MIQLNDQDQTYIPESIDECVQLALKESHNYNYDNVDRDANIASQHRYLGKLAEAQFCVALKQAGFEIIHGVRVDKKFADSGADLTVKDTNCMCRPIQIKTCSKYIKFYDRQFTTAEQNLNRLCRFEGPIIIKSKINDQVKWYCTDGEEIHKHAKHSDYGGYYVPTYSLSDEISDFSNASLTSLFERHSKLCILRESNVN